MKKFDVTNKKLDRLILLSALILILSILSMPSFAFQEKTQTEVNLKELSRYGVTVKTLCLDGYQFIVTATGNRASAQIIQVYEMYNHYHPGTPKRCKPIMVKPKQSN